MTSPYKGRRPSLVRTFWIYRNLIALAVVLGLMLWFIWANNAAVTVAFPFGLGKITSTLGLVILLSALVGAVVTALIVTMIYTVRRIRTTHGRPDEVVSDLPDDRPPPDYAAKATEGLPENHWP